MNWIQKFLIVCSGSNLKLIKKAPTEINKHIGIGGVILFTAILASISSGYALFAVFENTWYAIGFGLLWGLMIFNLDRFIVASMRKSGNFLQQLLSAMPRIVLAALLGLIISKPLELKIFEKEIDKQLNIIINRNKTILQDSITIRYAQQAGSYNQERNAIYTRIDSLRSDYNKSAQELEKEVVGTATQTTTGKQGYGSNAKRKEAIKNQKKEALESYQSAMKSRLSELDKSIDLLTQQKRTELDNTKPTEDNYNGFAARIQALDELGKNNAILNLASIFIMGLFISLEMAPVLVKLITPKGPYDYLLDKHEYEFKVYNNESKTKLDISSNERTIVHQQQSNQRILKAKKIE